MSDTKKRFEFSYNWNRKLDCKAFTTLRLSDQYEIGDVVEVYLIDNKKQANYLFDVTVRGKRKLTLDTINEYVAYLDTGYNVEECKTIIKRMYVSVKDWTKKPIYFYLLQRS